MRSVILVVGASVVEFFAHDIFPYPSKSESNYGLITLRTCLTIHWEGDLRHQLGDAPKLLMRARLILATMP